MPIPDNTKDIRKYKARKIKRYKASKKQKVIKNLHRMPLDGHISVRKNAPEVTQLINSFNKA